MTALHANDRVRIISWFDHAALIAARRNRAEVLGTVVRIREFAGTRVLSVHVDGVDGTFEFRQGDVEALASSADRGP